MKKPEIIKLIDNRWSSEAIIDLIKEQDLDINLTDKDNNSPLIVALIEGWFSLAEYLMEQGADIRHKGESGKNALYFAVHGGYLDILKKLHASGEPIESPSETGITTLMAVAGGAQEFHQKHLIQVAKFIDGKFVSPQDAEYKTLNPVTEESFLAVMDYLILHGADVNAQTHEVRHSPLIYCATNNTPALGQKLLDAGASVNYQDQDGMSALHWASRRGFAAVVKMLLENKADPNLGENYGFTPLHEAAENNHLKVLELLLANGADKSIGIQKGFGDFKAGCTAYDIARLKNYGAIIKGLT